MTVSRIVSLLGSIVVASALLAQSSAEVNAGIQYNFGSPGARSLARGGAFLADANDATAADANPAGLVNLPAREGSIELRSTRYVNVFTDHGRAFGPPTRMGTDTVAGIQQGSEANRVNNVAFLSSVFPLRNVSIAVYRHELANFAASMRTRGAFYTLDGNPNHRHFPAVSNLRLHIVGTGVSVGHRLSHPRLRNRLAVGFGIRAYQSQLDTVTTRYRLRIAEGPPDYTDVHSIQTQRGKAATYGLNAGLLFDVNRALSFGASYRQGLSFPVEVRYTPVPLEAGAEEDIKHTRFNVPAVYGAGVSVRPNDYWSIALDVNRITYSDTQRNFAFLFLEEPRYFVPDATEIRLGSEFIVTRDMHQKLSRLPFPIALCIGAWRDPDHSVRVSDPLDSQAVLFRPTGDTYHATFGIGALIGTTAQIHAAADYSRRQTVVSITAMRRF